MYRAAQDWIELHQIGCDLFRLPGPLERQLFTHFLMLLLAIYVFMYSFL